MQLPHLINSDGQFLVGDLIMNLHSLDAKSGLLRWTYQSERAVDRTAGC